MDAWTHAGHPSAPRSCTGAEPRRPPEPLEPEAEAREARAEEPEDAEGAEPGAVRAEAEARAEALWTAPSAQSSAQQSPELLARPLRPATPPSERQLGAEARDDESRFRFAEFRCALERRWTWERRSASPRRGPIRPSRCDGCGHLAEAVLIPGHSGPAVSMVFRTAAYKVIGCIHFCIVNSVRLPCQGGDSLPATQAYQEELIRIGPLCNGGTRRPKRPDNSSSEIHCQTRYRAFVVSRL